MGVMRLMVCSLLVWVSSVVCAQQVTGSVSFTDTATSKIFKTPIGTQIEALSKASSKHVVVLSATVDPATLSGATEFRYVLEEQLGGSDDYLLAFKFSDDPKYKPGATSVKVNFSTIGGVSPTGKVLVSAALKIGKDSITVTITDKVRPVYAQQFLNFSFKSDNSPEGAGTGARTTTSTISLGTLTSSVTGIPYNVAFKNKSKTVNGIKLWSGTSKGSAQ